MAKPASAFSTKLMLVLFLCCIAIIVLASLYVDSRRKMALMTQEIEQLKSSQVLLMVPEEQAANIANWLSQHPEQTQAIIKTGTQDEAKSVLIGPGAINDVESQDNHLPQSSDSAQTFQTQEVIVSENAQGVKVISLPNGGIRVTTRDDKQQKQQ
ncbi:membrane anchored protein in chemotaxis locus [Shewanella saliphila]|uniref:Membrane anchored protein in chemotaxis locus n=1 Tax=Shewanella saliphila TaxID=2282698 RepID=A0ABQ2Q2X7_9GAMM|nr:membrane anchored protein in chemotaxis locus [Shewanella saliphila]MCL1099762.1 membrane anchored protein in chemotaxis locus [Shewanella saliphila]GGP45414.1 membrane anchored protein in chemotaxis locus [Shewanella saliphila]